MGPGRKPGHKLSRGQGKELFGTGGASLERRLASRRVCMDADVHGSRIASMPSSCARNKSPVDVYAA